MNSNSMFTFDTTGPFKPAGFFSTDEEIIRYASSGPIEELTNNEIGFIIERLRNSFAPLALQFIQRINLRDLSDLFFEDYEEFVKINFPEIYQPSSLVSFVIANELKNGGFSNDDLRSFLSIFYNVNNTITTSTTSVEIGGNVYNMLAEMYLVVGNLISQFVLSLEIRKAILIKIEEFEEDGYRIKPDVVNPEIYIKHLAHEAAETFSIKIQSGFEDFCTAFLIELRSKKLSNEEILEKLDKEYFEEFINNVCAFPILSVDVTRDLFEESIKQSVKSGIDRAEIMMKFESVASFILDSDRSRDFVENLYENLTLLSCYEPALISNLILAIEIRRNLLIMLER